MRIGAPDSKKIEQALLSRDSGLLTALQKRAGVNRHEGDSSW